MGHGTGVESHNPVPVGPGNDDRLEKGTAVVAFEVRIRTEDPFVVVGADGNRPPAAPERRLTVTG